MERSDEGTGPLVVLLHSGGMSNRQWRRLAVKLSPRYRVVAPDFLGSGKNPAWPADQPFHFSQDVDAVIALLGELGEPAHLVGHSYGGFVALKVAEHAATQVRSLALYDPVAFGVLASEQDKEGLRDLAICAGANPIFRDPAVGGTAPWFSAFVDYWNGDGTWASLPEVAQKSFLAVGRKVFMEVDSLLSDLTPASAYVGLTMPALFMVGERSPVAARRLAAIIARSMPHGTLQEVAGQGHRVRSPVATA